jgi:hypothetical protein
VEKLDGVNDTKYEDEKAEAYNHLVRQLAHPPGYHKV